MLDQSEDKVKSHLYIDTRNIMKQLTLVPPSDPRVNTMLAPQNDLLLKEHGYENRQELSESLFEAMFFLIFNCLFIFII